LIVPRDRHIAIRLIDEAVTAGARYVKACAVLEVNVRTLQRWKKTLADQRNLEDGRKAAAAEPVSVNKDVASIDHAALDSCSFSA
jgi:putative transposase